MFEIERPKIECKELNDYYGCFVVEPLERGFGTCLLYTSPEPTRP